MLIYVIFFRLSEQEVLKVKLKELKAKHLKLNEELLAEIQKNRAAADEFNKSKEIKNTEHLKLQRDIDEMKIKHKKGKQTILFIKYDAYFFFTSFFIQKRFSSSA